MNHYLFSDTFLAVTCLVAGLIVVFPSVYLLIRWFEQKDKK
jgi:hypothetical protein